MNTGIIPNQKHSNLFFTLSYYVVFGLFFFFIIYFVFDPRLLNYKLQPFFACDSSYYDYYHHLHNGMLTIISQFILQYLHYPLIGSIILVLFFLVQAFLLSSIAEIKHTFFQGIEFIPSLFMLIYLKHYQYGLETIVSFTIAVLFLTLLKMIPEKLTYLRLVFQLIVIIFLFFQLGFLTALIFALLSIVTEITATLKVRRFIFSAVYLFLILFLTYKYLGKDILKPLLATVSPFNLRAMMPDFWYVLTLSIIVILTVYILQHVGQVQRFFIRLPWIISHSLVLLLILAGTIGFGRSLYGNPGKYNSEIEFYAGNNQWKKVLSLKSHVTVDDRISLFELNRALYHEGKMTEDLFTIPQQWGVHTLFLTIEFNRECTINNSDLFFEMGYIKASEYWALEAQTHRPYSPRVLQRLIQCSFLTGDFLVANKYLSIMQHSPIYKKWALDRRKSLITHDRAYFAKVWIGDVNINQDILFINSKEPNLDLIRILNSDRNNEMAFEYLLSYYLLSAELGNFDHFLKLFGNYKPERLPSLYQQALLMFQMGKNIPDDQLGFTISKAVKNTMLKFNKVLIEYNFNNRKAQKDLYRLYGDTYWYYLRYISPMSTKSSINRKKI
jgi:hypothetical protein